MEHRCTQLANQIMALRDGLPNTKHPIEIKYRTAVLSLCREITEGPIDAPFGQITPEKPITED